MSRTNTKENMVKAMDEKRCAPTQAFSVMGERWVHTRLTCLLFRVFLTEFSYMILQDTVSRDDLCGYVYVDLRLLPDNQTIDKWFPMIPKNAKKRRGSRAKVRLIVHKQLLNPGSDEPVKTVRFPEHNKATTFQDLASSRDLPLVSGSSAAQVYGNFVFLQSKPPQQVSPRLGTYSLFPWPPSHVSYESPWAFDDVCTCVCLYTFEAQCGSACASSLATNSTGSLLEA